jgi:hypothetical protein
MNKPLVVALALAFLSSFAVAKTVGWPEATDALAVEKSKADACVSLLKSVNDKPTLVAIAPVYRDAKGISDGLLAGLSTVVAQHGRPSNLPQLREKIEKSGFGLQKVCDAADASYRAASGGKGPVDEAVKAAIGPMIDALKAAVGGIFDYWKETDKAEREMILGQLRDAKWPEL